ncbi:hypothetical protein RJ639_001902 [Escallonia herrerae]|uniref:Expansin-like EG45 domain-containing protein n=1 Tax=Escallonia herrerae TaxID=1293975 RepID=A0AA88XCM0_9ASTE|nr:hypothetical protein RJ639_001902 [Escallonia herrerae]
MKKLDDKSDKFIFIGYSQESKGYKLYNPIDKKVKVSRDVTFDEKSSWVWTDRDKEQYVFYLIDMDRNEVEEELIEPVTPLSLMFDDLKKEMAKEFEMTDIVLMSYYLGIEVNNELANTLKAYRYQQHRWCCGLANLFRKMAMEIISNNEEIAIEAIKHAVKALRKRHLLEEGSHGPAFIALARHFASQLVVEVAESRASKALAVEKEAGLTKTQNELTQARDECPRLAALLEENTKGLDLLISENKDLKAQLEEIKQRANSAEAENRMFVDRWMLQKMQDAERLNDILQQYLSPNSVVHVKCPREVSLVLGDIGTATSYGPPYTPTKCNGNRQDQFPPGNLFVSVSEGLWDNGAACGRRYRLKCLSGTKRPCKGGTVDVKVVDFCSKRPCPSTIVMSSSAFSAISHSPKAKINDLIRTTQRSCSPYHGGLAVTLSWFIET